MIPQSLWYVATVTGTGVQFSVTGFLGMNMYTPSSNSSWYQSAHKTYSPKCNRRLCLSSSSGRGLVGSKDVVGCSPGGGLAGSSGSVESEKWTSEELMVATTMYGGKDHLLHTRLESKGLHWPMSSYGAQLGHRTLKLVLQCVGIGPIMLSHYDLPWRHNSVL